ncbi:MAG: 50S ribosomal protein L10 [candidate division Zixibacteria bacterium]|nr:50S ribosomal protein L10 [candidate division Zixibacteria bacterium]
MLKVEKEKTVSKLKEKMSLTKSLFLTDFRGLNVEEMTKLRRELKKGGAEYKITKNTMIRMAAKQSGFEGILDYLKEPTGLVFSYEDPISPAKVLYEVHKRVEKPKIKVIWMEGRLLDENYLKRLAVLPPREVILAQIFSGLNSPVANFVGTLQGVLRNFVGTLDAIKEAKSAQA